MCRCFAPPGIVLISKSDSRALCQALLQAVPPAVGSASNTNQIRKAQDAIVSDLLSSKWREEHPDAILWQPYPIEKHYDPDIPEPEPLPTNDWTDFELRAFVEKRHWKARKDAEWQQRQQDVGRSACSLMMLLFTCTQKSCSHMSSYRLQT